MTTDIQQPTRTRYSVTMTMGAAIWANIPELRDDIMPNLGAGYSQAPSMMRTYGHDTEEAARAQARDLRQRYPESEVVIDRAEQVWYPGTPLSKPAWTTRHCERIEE